MTREVKAPVTAWNCKSPQCTTEGQTIGHPGCCSPISGFREFSFPKKEILIFERTTLLHPPRQNQKGRTCRRRRVSFQPTTQIVRQTCQASCRSVQANNVVRGSCWLLVSRVLNGLCRQAGRVQVTPRGAARRQTTRSLAQRLRSPGQYPGPPHCETNDIVFLGHSSLRGRTSQFNYAGANPDTSSIAIFALRTRHGNWIKPKMTPSGSYLTFLGAKVEGPGGWFTVCKSFERRRSAY